MTTDRISEITMYVTTDGQVWNNEATAKMHQKWIDSADGVDDQRAAAKAARSAIEREREIGSATEQSIKCDPLPVEPGHFKHRGRVHGYMILESARKVYLDVRVSSDDESVTSAPADSLIKWVLRNHDLHGFVSRLTDSERSEYDNVLGRAGFKPAYGYVGESERTADRVAGICSVIAGRPDVASGVLGWFRDNGSLREYVSGLPTLVREIVGHLSADQMYNVLAGWSGLSAMHDGVVQWVGRHAPISLIGWKLRDVRRRCELLKELLRRDVNAEMLGVINEFCSDHYLYGVESNVLSEHDRVMGLNAWVTADVRACASAVCRVMGVNGEFEKLIRTYVLDAVEGRSLVGGGSYNPKRLNVILHSLNEKMLTEALDGGLSILDRANGVDRVDRQTFKRVMIRWLESHVLATEFPFAVSVDFKRNVFKYMLRLVESRDDLDLVGVFNKYGIGLIKKCVGVKSFRSRVDSIGSVVGDQGVRSHFDAAVPTALAREINKYCRRGPVSTELLRRFIGLRLKDVSMDRVERHGERWCIEETTELCDRLDWMISLFAASYGRTDNAVRIKAADMLRGTSVLHHGKLL